MFNVSCFFKPQNCVNHVNYNELVFMACLYCNFIFRKTSMLLLTQKNVLLFTSKMLKHLTFTLQVDTI